MVLTEKIAQVLLDAIQNNWIQFFFNLSDEEIENYVE